MQDASNLVGAGESERNKDVESIYAGPLCPLVLQNLIPREHIDRAHTGMNHSSEEVTIKESCSQVVSSHSSHANPFLSAAGRPFHTLHLACLPQTSGNRFRRRHSSSRRSSTSLHGLLQGECSITFCQSVLAKWFSRAETSRGSDVYHVLSSSSTAS